jgi:hypothetical protein
VSERIRARKAIRNLVKGAPAAQKSVLPSCSVRNAFSALKHGHVMTDTIADWVKNDFVAGPFSSPPFKNFRSNCLVAIEQPNKVRPVLDISLPKGQSFNDNVSKHLVEKTKMATAQNFAYSLREAGFGAVMSKFDAKDAYKMIPAPIQDYPSQGFCWLGKYFFEKKQIFGASTSVANYDIFSNTVKNLALCYSPIPRCLVFRCLDDVPVISPASSNDCANFSATYVDLCDDLNIELAKECPKAEKAFTNKTVGKVLGINFNSANLTWSYTETKISKVLIKISRAMDKKNLSLKSLQELLGSLNDFALLCPFMRSFKFALNECLRVASINKSCIVTENARSELKIWAACLMANKDGFPIPARPTPPPIFSSVFVSDAAGVPIPSEFHGNEGVGGIGFDSEGIIICAYQFQWTKDFISFIDSKGACMGSKTTSLEIIGILLHLVLFPSLFCDRHVIFKTDNIACYYGWDNRALKNDCMASIVLRAIAVISARLCCHIHFSHLPRLSSWEGRVVDRLSRKSTSSKWDCNLVSSFGSPAMPASLVHWLSHPSEDWSLPLKIADEIVPYH